MNQELQDSVRISDLAYTIKATLSHKITISNVLLERFSRARPTTAFGRVVAYTKICAASMGIAVQSRSSGYIITQLTADVRQLWVS